MEWSDQGIVVGIRRHGETSVILEALTRGHGRHSGFVHGGRSRRLRPCLQPGNTVDLVWRSRIEDQLGTFVVEPRRLRAAGVMAAAASLHAVNHLCALVRLLAEREPHGSLHDRLDALLDSIDDLASLPPSMVRFELEMLRDLGFGLDLSCCAATGTRRDLAYVSPKSGRAVSREAGEPYRARLLALPPFLAGADAAVEACDLAAGFRLTGFFLERDVFAPRGQTLPAPRAYYLGTLALIGPDGPSEAGPAEPFRAQPPPLRAQ